MDEMDDPQHTDYFRIIDFPCIESIGKAQMALASATTSRFRLNHRLILLCQINGQARHTRREAGIQCHGWQAQIHPWSLDSGNPCRNDDLGKYRLYNLTK
jgi:hypothetical protein